MKRLAALILALWVAPGWAALTAHFDASDNDHLFTTFNGGGTHTGTPSDGSAVQVAEEESDSTLTDVILLSDVGTEPDWRSSTLLLMSLPNLDFNGSTDYLRGFTQTAGGIKTLDDLWNAAAGTALFVVYLEACTSTDADPYDNDGLFSDDGFMAVGFRDTGSGCVVRFYNFDGSVDSVQTAITVGVTSIILIRHGSGQICISVNDGTEACGSSGSTAEVDGQFKIATNFNDTAPFNGRFGEGVFWDTDLGASPTELDPYMAKWLPSVDVTIDSVTPDTFEDLDTGIVIAGSNFEASQGGGTVTICPTDDVMDLGCEAQSVTAWADDEITFTAALGGLDEDVTSYLFVTNDTGDSNAAGFEVEFSSGAAPSGLPVILQQVAANDDEYEPRRVAAGGF